MADKRIFIVVKNPEWDNLKPGKVHLFGKDYFRDGSKELIHEVLHEGLEYMQKGMVYDEEFPFFYWTYEGKGSFIDFFVTPDLLADTRTFEDFELWLRGVVADWAVANKLPLKIESNKDREYYLKFIIHIPNIIQHEKTSSNPTSFFSTVMQQFRKYFTK